MSWHHPIHVLLVPGADGRVGTEDSAPAQAGGMVSHPMKLPPFQGHPIDDQRSYDSHVASLMHTEVRSIG
jgi:hypothetical protein